MDRKAPPNDDYLSQRKQGDTDSADSSSIDDVSQCHGTIFHFDHIHVRDHLMLI